MGLTFSGFGMEFEINSRYEVGEEFSEEDASFVKEHGVSLSENSCPD